MPATFNRTTSQDKTGWKHSWHVGGRILCAVVLVTRMHMAVVVLYRSCNHGRITGKRKKMGDRIFSFRVG